MSPQADHCTGREPGTFAFAKKVKVAPGSDAGAYMVPHGKGICRNMKLFARSWEIDRKCGSGCRVENVRSGKDSVENNVKKACEKSSHRSSIFNAV